MEYYDFDVYQGGDGTRPELGQGADVVLKLTSTLEANCNYKVYADNLSTGVSLIVKLAERGKLKEEKKMKKEGRGTYDSKVAVIITVT